MIVGGDVSPLLLAPEGYQISRSVRLRSSATAYLSRSAYPVASAGTRWTLSIWVKRGALSNGDLFSFVSTTGAAQQAGIQFDGNNNIRWWQYAAPSYQFHKITTAVFRDPSAWYHLVFDYDTTLATAADRCQIFVNGIRQTAFSTSVDPSLNLVTYYKTGTLYPYIGAENRNASSALTPFDGYITEVNFIDGQSLDPSSFGETNQVTGVWQPKKYTGTYGTNGFYLNFSDNSAATAAAIGKDYSGNGNDWTPNNISVTANVTYDSMLDVPTQWADGGNGRGNYAVLNPIDKGANSTVLEGNLAMHTPTSGGTAFVIRSSISIPSSGKWYWEGLSAPLNGNPANNAMLGVIAEQSALTSYVGSTSTGYGYYANNGNKYNNGSASAYGATYTNTDVIGIAFDADAGTLTFYKNNVSQGIAFSGLTGTTYFAAVGNGGSGAYINFGQRPFAYTPPTGFRALNTLNLPTPTILKGNQFMDATLYTGNGTSISSTQTISSLSFQPDLVWIKDRSNGINNSWSHYLVDAVRGINSNGSAYLASNETSAETGANSGFGITALNSNGFSLKANGTLTNTNGDAYIAWTWKEGATQGFDIVTYTGNGANRTIAHNLGVAPNMVIIKSRSSAQSWPVGHSSLTSWAHSLALDLTSAQASNPTVFNSTAPTSTVFSVGTNNAVNQSSVTYVAYLFSQVAGFSRFGSYTGNGSTDGPFVFCGFRPRFVLVKRTDGADSWQVWDTARDTYNVTSANLYPNLSNAEVTDSTQGIDIVANGFKLRTSNVRLNASGGTYIFAAFAENPTKYALAR